MTILYWVLYTVGLGLMFRWRGHGGIAVFDLIRKTITSISQSLSFEKIKRFGRVWSTAWPPVDRVLDSLPKTQLMRVLWGLALATPFAVMGSWWAFLGVAVATTVGVIFISHGDLHLMSNRNNLIGDRASRPWEEEHDMYENATRYWMPYVWPYRYTYSLTVKYIHLAVQTVITGIVRNVLIAIPAVILADWSYLQAGVFVGASLFYPVATYLGNYVDYPKIPHPFPSESHLYGPFMGHLVNVEFWYGVKMALAMWAAFYLV